MKKPLIIIVILAVVGALVATVLALNNSTQPDTNSSVQTRQDDTDNSSQQSDGVVISFDGTGFSPANVMIQRGESVTFHNDSDTEVWPASDDHPTHTKLPEFDSQRSLEKGESYSYTFEKVGEWAYHDHIFPGYSGVIVVTE